MDKSCQVWYHGGELKKHFSWSNPMFVPITLTALLCIFPSTTLSCLRFLGWAMLGWMAVVFTVIFLFS